MLNKSSSLPSLAMQTNTAQSVHLPLLGTFRFVLTSVFGAVVPCILFYYPDYWRAIDTPTGINSTIAAIIAASVAAYSVKRISTYPGVATIGFLIPIFSSCFGLSILTLFVARLPQSNVILSIAFAGSLITCFSLLMNIRPQAQIRFLAVPGGRVERLFSLPALAYDIARIPADLNPANLNHAGAIVVADLHHDHEPAWEQAIARATLAGTAVYHYKHVWETATGRVQIEHLSENNFGSLIPSHGYVHAKRLADFGVSLVLAPFIIVPLLLIALAIRLDSPGPALFSQMRGGFRGKPFNIYKFRTMYVEETACENYDSSREQAMTKVDDARVTRLGRFLRRSRIDELPQIINIIMGQMSWIGPRPEAVELASWYEREIPFYSYRHIVRPGITGWAQVNQGHVTSLDDVSSKLQYDFFYIRNFSYWIDMLIVMRSLQVMINGFGAK